MCKEFLQECRLLLVKTITTKSLPEWVTSLNNLQVKIPLGSNDQSEDFVNDANEQLRSRLASVVIRGSLPSS